MTTMQDEPEERDEGRAPRFYQGNQTTFSNQGSLCREEIERMISEHEGRLMYYPEYAEAVRPTHTTGLKSRGFLM
jgi:hypothetical protein